MNIITTKGLAKTFGKRIALDDVCLNVPKGSIYGFLGCNGAGKTTCLSILSGVIRKTRGKIDIDSIDPDKEEDLAKKRIGCMLQEMNLFSGKTVRSNLLFYASLKGITEDIDKYLKRFDIQDLANIKAGALSHGQQKLVLIIQAFMGDPGIVILDEPISGFDPKRIIMLREFIRKKRGDQTIIISSHNLDEIDRLCSHIGIIHDGKLRIEGEKKKIKGRKSLEKVFIELLE